MQLWSHQCSISSESLAILTIAALDRQVSKVHQNQDLTLTPDKGFPWWINSQELLSVSTVADELWLFLFVNRNRLIMNSFRILFYLIAYFITRTHANNDWCGLCFSVFYAVTAIPHIVDMISISEFSSLHFNLLFGMHDQEYMLMMNGVVCIFLYFMQWRPYLTSLTWLL